MKTNNRFKTKHYLLMLLAAAFAAISVNVISSFASSRTELTDVKILNTSQTIEVSYPAEKANIEKIELPIRQSTEPSTSTIAFNDVISKQSKLGHFHYQEAKEEDLVIVASYAQGQYQRYERLHKDAALALMQMIYAARDSGVWIVPVSGYRDVDKQDYLFKAQVRRRGSETAAAKLSAPPGHSEHHSGYTVDLTDGHLLNQDITYKFASTEAYQWLTNNANKFGFELSFPENNSQGVSFEPWHWRYVGSPDALKTFAEARKNIN